MQSKLVNEVAKLRCLVEQQRVEIQTLKNAISGLPSMVYWKNCDGVYMGENRASFEGRVGCGMIHAIVGLCDHDIFSSQSANKYRENDLLVIDSRKPLVDEEILVLQDGKCIPQLSIKSPIYDDKDEKVIGVFGQTVPISLPIIQSAKKIFSFPAGEPTISKLKFFITVSLLLSGGGATKKRIENQSLTAREKECAYYLLKGGSVKTIGEALGISDRTVESHINNMKNKLQCLNKSQLVEKLFSLCYTLFDA